MKDDAPVTKYAMMTNRMSLVPLILFDPISPKLVPVAEAGA